MVWKPVMHNAVKDFTLRETLHNIGYVVSGNIGIKQIELLQNLYSSVHNFTEEQGGMFYSLYSNNLDYRGRVNSEIASILKDVYDSTFVNYKTVINSFIVKLPGPKSDFTLHQDSTGLDEMKYSPLSVWIPLQDTNLENGTLCVVPKTHRLFHPYRGISFPSAFSSYENVLKRYLVPITLKAGDILLFDNRLVHYSHINNSSQPRIVAMSGVFPKEAEIQSVYKDESVADSPLEIYRHSDDFLVTNTAFYENCTVRPYRGEVIQKITEPLESITVYDFLSWAVKNNVDATNIPQLSNAKLNMLIVSEPA